MAQESIIYKSRPASNKAVLIIVVLLGAAIFLTAGYWLLLSAITYENYPFNGYVFLLTFMLMGILMTIFTLDVHKREAVLYQDKIVIKKLIGEKIVYKNNISIVGPYSYNFSLNPFALPIMLSGNSREKAFYNPSTAIQIETKVGRKYIWCTRHRDEFLAKIGEAWGDAFIEGSS